MPWYFIEASHGPGHQSTTERFIWQATSVNLKNEDAKELLIEEAFNVELYRLTDPIFAIKMVRKLPKRTHDTLMRMATSRRDNSTALLNVLTKTATYRDRCPEVDRTRQCALEINHRGACDFSQARVNREKFGWGV